MARYFSHFVLLVSVLPIFSIGATPYQGSPFYFSSTLGDHQVIEAEYYDNGPDGETYHDSTSANEGGELRSDGVDISDCGDGCRCVTSVTAGEWLLYSINNSEEGNFDIELRTASTASTASIILDIAKHTQVVAVPYSGGLDSWRTTTVFNLKLPKGPLTLRVSTPTGKYNLDFFKFIRRSTGESLP